MLCSHYICTFLESNFFQTIFLGIVGLSAYFIYRKQVADTLKNAAKMVKLEIDSIEEAVKNLRLTKLHEDIYKTSPLYESLEWFKVRNLFIGIMDIDSVKAINNFYNRAIVLEDAREKVKQTVHVSRIAKTEYTQADISRIIMEASKNIGSDIVSGEDIEQTMLKIQNFKSLFDVVWADFFPNGVLDHFTNALYSAKEISNSPAYVELKRIIDGD